MAALPDLRMPGVYTQEIQTLPPTVGVIQSAVPVFIGYTQMAEKKGENLLNIPTRIKSMREYEDWFGGPPNVKLTVEIDDRPTNPRRPSVNITSVDGFKHKMYHALRLYYANGGGPCFITSVGDFSSDPQKEALIEGIRPAIKVKDITILVFPDGTSLADNNYKDVIEAALAHCVKMKNRVTIIDVNDSFGENYDDIEEVFQTNMPSDIEIKKYGMAYYPGLQTGLSYAYDPNEVTITKHLPFVVFKDDAPGTPDGKTAAEKTKDYQTLLTKESKIDTNLNSLNATKDFLAALVAEFKSNTGDNAALKTAAEKIAAKHKQTIDPKLKAELSKADGKPKEELPKVIEANDASITDKKKEKKESDEKLKTSRDGGFDIRDKKVEVYSGKKLNELQGLNGQFYEKVREGIQNVPVPMPPSPAIAGIYVRTDATQGVWKAPANVSVFGSIKPTIDIDDDLHANLNAPSNGKSINVIRTYPGRGLLVYGARTLAGNDLEWRYVNVRRTFCFIEDSVARAMQDFVFEPNTPQTWIKVKSMIKSFLNRLWKAGGLYGNTPEDAYEVICGEPDSFSVEEMLSGIMRIFIKVAVARPAEFIVLQYEHKFQIAES